MYARPPRLATARVISGQLAQVRPFRWPPDHGALGVVAMLHCINQGQSGFTLRQVVAQMFSEAGFVGLVVERVIDQLKCGPDVPADTAPAIPRSRAGHRSSTAAICAPASKQPRGLAADDVDIARFGGIAGRARS